MEVLLRHTLLGECLRFAGLSHLSYAEERDSGLSKNLRTIHNEQAHAAEADENTRLLTDGEETYGAETLVVDWYSANDPDVSMLVRASNASTPLKLFRTH